MSKARPGRRAALVPMFALFYVVLAPFVGAFADSIPKGKVMFVSNSIKVVGCLMMLFGSHPLLAYAVVGLGAAAYSPAKYGILTELLPPSQLVKGNGWIEGLTVGSIILGGAGRPARRAAHRADAAGLGPAADRHQHRHRARSRHLDHRLHLHAGGVFNLYIPRTDAPLQPLSGSVADMVRDFSHCNARLWADKLGQISLATTTLLWGSSATCVTDRVRLGRRRAGLQHHAGVEPGGRGDHRVGDRRRHVASMQMKLDRPRASSRWPSRWIPDDRVAERSSPTSGSPRPSWCCWARCAAS
jgi:hypothetical protein